MFFQSKVKVGPNGKIPSRASKSDIGYDLMLVNKKEEYDWGPNIEVYGTDVYLQPMSEDFYFEIVPRSSMTKSPYILANSVGTIDPNYTGEILVALRKVDLKRPSLKLPISLVQLIPLKRIDVDFIQVEELSDTVRGAGGFGSTNHRWTRDISDEAPITAEAVKLLSGGESFTARELCDNDK